MSELILQKPFSPELAPTQDFEAFVEEWTDRSRLIHATADEQPSRTTDDKGLHFKKFTYYHGSPVAGIDVMNIAEDHTLARGVYGTYEPNEGAIGYAIHRNRGIHAKDQSPVLYELQAKNISFLDLRPPEAIETFLDGFKIQLQSWSDQERDNSNWFQVHATKTALEAIDNEHLSPYVKLKAMSARSDLINSYINSMGFQGMVGLEGGEGDIGNHESWIVLDPNRVSVTAEAEFVDPNPPAPLPEPTTRANNAEWWE